MSLRRRHRVIASVVLIALALAVAAGVAVRPLLSVGVAYKAKTLCSEVFTARRAVDDVVADLAIDDLRPLRFIRASIDADAQTTTSGVPGLLRRSARHVDGFGCTLAPWQSPQQTVHAGRHAVSAGATTHAAPLPALEAVLDEAFAEPEEGPRRRTRAVVVLRHGAIIAERYAAGIGADTPLAGWSMTKSVLNALIGIAVREGTLTLDAPAGLRAWSGADDARAAITIRDLLRMSSGLEFHEDQSSASADILQMLYRHADMAAFAAGRRLVAAPGSVWNYSSGTSLILSRVLRERLGDSAYHEFPRRALFDPLGMTRATLEVDGTGTFVASSYMYATAREWARFGQLYLQDGAWGGQRILPADWVAFTTTPAPADTLRTYGAHFWLATPAEYRGPPATLPPGIYHAAGHEAQFITIVPSHGVVIVRLGRTRYPGAWSHDRFVAAVLAAL